jgi:hypothetical protein
MSAVLTRRRPSRARDRDRGRQERLFVGVGAAEVTARPAPPTPAPPAPPHAPVHEPPEPESEPHAGAPASTRTLEDAITALWDDLRSGEAASCPVCGSAMQPRHSASAGVVGGRCGACDTTLA